MTDEQVEGYFNFALKLVDRAGTLVREAFEQPASAVTTKSSNIDLVTETDKAVEELLIAGLSQAFPDHKFIGEESVSGGAKVELTDSPTWIIDPIDGTTNFVHRIPLIGICVGLAIKKQLRAGIVYNPISRELFSAVKGRGATKNGFPIHVSNTQEIEKSVICSSLGIHNLTTIGEGWLDISLSNQRKTTLAGVRGHRAFGSAAINTVYVAQGSIDAYMEYGLHCWDIAAAAIILKEAGGHVIDPTGKPFNLMGRSILCAGTEKLAKDLTALLTHSEFEPEGDAIQE